MRTEFWYPPKAISPSGMVRPNETESTPREEPPTVEAKPLDVEASVDSVFFGFNSRPTILVQQVTDEIATAVPNLVSTTVDTISFEPRVMWERLDLLREEIVSDPYAKTVSVGTATVVTTTLSVGYILWTLRGGYLVASLLSTLPAWRLVDPLPILENMDFSPGSGKPESDDETPFDAIIAG